MARKERKRRQQSVWLVLWRGWPLAQFQTEGGARQFAKVRGDPVARATLSWEPVKRSPSQRRS